MPARRTARRKERKMPKYGKFETRLGCFECEWVRENYDTIYWGDVCPRCGGDTGEVIARPILVINPKNRGLFGIERCEQAPYNIVGWERRSPKSKGCSYCGKVPCGCGANG